MTPDNAVQYHLFGILFCLFIGPMLCGFVVAFWRKIPPSKNYRGDKHW